MGIHVCAALCSCLLLLLAWRPSLATPITRDIKSLATDERETPASRSSQSSGQQVEGEIHDSSCRDRKPYALRLFGAQSPTPGDRQNQLVCSDKTPAGYYHRLETSHGVVQSKTWVIFLEGGFYCHDNTSCSQVRHGEHALAGSSRWLLERTFWGHGILSSNSRDNPYLFNANKIYIPYCSRDLWSGDQSYNGSASDQRKNVFMGSRIFRAVIDDLITRHQLDDAKYVVLAGQSAGGVGVALHIDEVRSLLQRGKSRRRPKPIVQGLVSSAWFVYNDSCLDASKSRSCVPQALAGTIKQGFRRWESKVPDACRRHFRTKPWMCIFLPNLHRFINSDLVVLQWMYDTFVYNETGILPQQWHDMSVNAMDTLKTASRDTPRSRQMIAVTPHCVGHNGPLDSTVMVDIKVRNCSLADIMHISYSVALAGGKSNWKNDIKHCNRTRKVYSHQCPDPLSNRHKCPERSRTFETAALAISNLPVVAAAKGSRKCSSPTSRSNSGSMNNFQQDFVPPSQSSYY